MSDRELTNARDNLLGSDYNNLGAVEDIFAACGDGSWDVFYCEEALEGYVDIDVDDIIVEFNGEAEVEGEAVPICAQFAVFDDDSYDLLYADIDGEPLEADDAVELLEALAEAGDSETEERGHRRAGGSRKSSARSAAGRSGGGRSSGKGGRTNAEKAAFAAWCEENGYEYSEEYWEEFEESDEYEEYLEDYEDEDDEDYDDEDEDDEDDEDDDEDYDDEDEEDDDEDYDDEEDEEDDEDYDDEDDGGDEDYDDGGDEEE